MEKSDFEKIIESYDYYLSQELIANAPASPRDSARLLVFNNKTSRAHIGTFKSIQEYLSPKSVLVFNKTKVIPARLILRKETGGAVEILYLRHDSKFIYALSNKKLRPKSRLYIDQAIFFEVIDKKDKEYCLAPSFKANRIFNILEKYGTTPLPPYIKNSKLSENEIKKEYQAVFAKVKGSIAAPTASLHFTKRLLEQLKLSGHTVCFVTLHVNLGTFAPFTKEQFKEKKLHEEWFEIDKKTAETLNTAKNNKKTIIAVGTTVVRTLESSCNKTGKLEKLSGMTTLFINAGYKFKFCDGVVTNFHVPKSSLLMLVSAFIGRRKLFQLYKMAMQEKLRFFSFGDGMLLLNNKTN